ncbi:acyl-CoA dehydrogenase, long-chain specific precursor [Trichosporon asahii var. asahii CBS 8904]|uniref:Acyl-CoA dehydrogenase, long-chain specific n=1 Tax=Trichosporon asahii var. asahii (strain CBS 8904) TaxID=1220162 RepID=K1VQE2_TRIAC|nr:acyl-CoA dehydrogenase, long-chain specific precursor [Trichosporon asahii var. asahii CBS 8904]
MATTKEFTRDEVAKHNKQGDLWVIIDSNVYDLSKFAKLHPGGLSVLTDPDVAGKDATTVFFSLHRMDVLQKYPKLIIGRIRGETPTIKPLQPGDLSRVPYAEPAWLVPQFSSPYYKDSHRLLRKNLRKFVDEVITPEARANEISGEKASDQAFIATLLFDPSMSALPIYGSGMGASLAIGTPPVKNFAKEPLRSRVLGEILRGEKVACLAITEAFAGSDVSAIRSRATKQPDGSWRLDGTKKWITAGMYADYFMVAARTYGGSAPDGSISCFLVERQPGLETTRIPTMYSPAAGTAYVTFDSVKVPPENLIGEEGKGLFIVFSNFNHERWSLVAGTARTARTIVEECLLWAAQRSTFGKPLITQPVIRYKLAGMIGKVEAIQAWLEHVTHQMTTMDYRTQATHLAGPLAFLKVMSTRWTSEITDDAVQIFGGRGLTTTGVGRYIEQYHRSRKFEAVGGGSEEIMANLGVKQLMRSMPKDQRL